MESIKKNSEFQHVYRYGKSAANRLLIMYVVENHRETNRLGISVSKKIGNSVVRHHFCRLVREAYRRNEENLKKGFDLVIVARKGVESASYQEICEALLHLYGKQKL